MQLPLALRQRLQRRTVMVVAAVLALIAVAAVGATWCAGFAPHDTTLLDCSKGPSAQHLLGTDEPGRDLCARFVHGVCYSQAIAAMAALGAVACGTLPGLVAGLFRRLDAPLMRVMDAMMSFPRILLAMALAAILGPSLATVVLALALGLAIMVTALSPQLLGDDVRGLLEPKRQKAA